MKETGIVINLKDTIAVVKVERESASGSCCHFDTKSEAFVEAVNLCGAKINDLVELRSEGGARKKAALLRLALCAMLFIGGLVIGDRLASVTGRAEQKDAISFGSGAVFAVSAFFFSRRKPSAPDSGLPVVSGIVPRL
ncbi:MAG: SoxR reducing system RseC family protein [Spirochaetaceae bacterium]|nr:SoxR reducing system RseC family protein [Spirochaetaceae bacterium]